MFSTKNKITDANRKLYTSFLDDVGAGYKGRTDLRLALRSHLWHYFTQTPKHIGETPHKLTREQALEIVDEWLKT